MKSISLERKSEYSEPTMEISKEVYPELYIELDKDPELAPEGTLTVRYRVHEKTIRTEDGNSPMVCLCLEINEILDHQGVESFKEEKSDHKMSEDMLDQMAGESDDSDDDEDAKPTVTIAVMKHK